MPIVIQMTFLPECFVQIRAGGDGKGKHDHLNRGVCLQPEIARKMMSYPKFLSEMRK